LRRSRLSVPHGGRGFPFRRSSALHQAGETPRKSRKWKRIVLWSAAALLLAVLLLGAGSYMWFRAQVSSANERITPEVRQALQESNSDQLLGITETTWLGAPAASKGSEVTRNGTVFTVVRNGAQVQRVWWKAGGVLYFVSNTLSDWVDQDEMLRIAESMIAVPR
jgi:hypothetical protein